MTQTFDVKISLTPASVSMLQILAFVVIGLMTITFCLPPIATGGKVGDIALQVGGVALVVAGGAAVLGASPVIVKVATVVAIGAGAVAVVDGVIDLFTRDDSSS